jgi:hypothetical protein
MVLVEDRVMSSRVTKSLSTSYGSVNTCPESAYQCRTILFASRFIDALAIYNNRLSDTHTAKKQRKVASKPLNIKRKESDQTSTAFQPLSKFEKAHKGKTKKRQLDKAAAGC